MEAVPLKKKSETVEGQAVAGGGLAAHVANFLDCMTTRNLPNADVAIGAQVAKMTHLANVSCRLGKPLAWDNAAGKFRRMTPTPLSNRITIPRGNFQNTNPIIISMK